MTDRTAATDTVPPTVAVDPVAVVRAFLGALERTDIDAAAALLDPEVSYQNVPAPPLRGRAATERALRFLERFHVGFEVHYDNVAADGDVVLTERTDVLVLGPVRIAFWVCGTFEVRDGRITVWRDRFDFFDFTRGVVAGLLRAAVRRGARAGR